MESFNITIADKTYKVEIGDLTSSPLTVRVNGHVYTVEWERVKPTSAPAKAAVSVAEVSQVTVSAPQKPVSIAPTGGELVEVTAPMPGKILQVNVQAGDEVQYGQQVCSLEAMKMESAIQSTAAGIVVSVNVSEGDTVQYGEVLAVIEKRGG